MVQAYLGVPQQVTDEHLFLLILLLGAADAHVQSHHDGAEETTLGRLPEELGRVAQYRLRSGEGR